MLKKSPTKEIAKKTKGPKSWSKVITIVIIIAAVGVIVGGVVIFAQGDQAFKFFTRNSQEEVVVEEEKNKYVELLAEVYDKIQENYWEVISDEDLFNLYKLGTGKIQEEQIPEIQMPEVTISNDKAGMKNMTLSIIEKLEDAKKKNYTVNVAAIVLANLQPFGRSGLYTMKKQQDLTDRVLNRDPDTNLYDVLEVTESATQEEIEQAIEQKTDELEQIVQDESQTEEAKQEAEEKLALVTRAEETLIEPETRETYNEHKIESTVYSEIVHPTVLYLKIKQLSPLTYDEFQKEANRVDAEVNDKLDSLILDLRGNVGGSVDLLPYFLGPFIGLNQYAYDWYQQGEYTPFKTLIDWLPSLVRYKKVIALVDAETQSSAEVMTATLKKYNVAAVVGHSTKGWGTIERVFELENQISDEETYSMFLVHHITMRDDNLPIEGRGVDPHVNIDDANWKEQLLDNFFVTNAMVNAVEDLWFEE